MRRELERRLWMVVLTLSAVAGIVAVAMALTRPEEIADRYLPPGAPDWIVPSFAPADALAYVLLPALAVVGLSRRAPWTGAVLWTAFGATSFTFVGMVGGAIVAGVPWTAPLSAIPPLGIYFAAALASRAGWARRDGTIRS